MGLGMTKLSDDNESGLVVEIPPRFQEYLDVILVRLQALFPDCRFSRTDCTISVHGSENRSQDQVRRTILYTAYREKIYAETLGMRQALVEAVTAR